MISLRKSKENLRQTKKHKEKPKKNIEKYSNSKKNNEHQGNLQETYGKTNEKTATAIEHREIKGLTFLVLNFLGFVFCSIVFF